MNRWLLAAALAAGLSQLAWLGTHPGPIAAGNRLYRQGKYDEAAEQYGQALADNPDSPLIRFNLSAAQYKQRKFADAIAALRKIATEEGDERAARVAYNLGNAYFRLGHQSAESDPQAAIAAYEQALVAYKRAMAADPQDEDAKFNHEFVDRELTELKRKLEEKQKEQEKQDQESEPEQDKEQQPPAQQDQDQEEQENKQQQEPQPTPEASKGEQQEAAAPPAGGSSEEQAAEPSETEQELDRQQAAAVIDTARDEEVRPEEIDRSQGAALLGAPLKNW